MEFQFSANDFILDWIMPNKKFLDLACGNCQLLDYARSNGCDVTGLDINPKRGSVIKHDLNEPLPFPKNSFDTAACIDSLEHVRNVSQVFKEVHRILKDKGIFIVTVPNTRWYKNPRHVSYFTYKYMLQLIKCSRFSIEKERHYIEIPKLKKRIVFKWFPEICFHFVFKLRK